MIILSTITAALCLALVVVLSAEMFGAVARKRVFPRSVRNRKAGTFNPVK